MGLNSLNGLTFSVSSILSAMIIQNGGNYEKQAFIYQAVKLNSKNKFDNSES